MVYAMATGTYLQIAGNNHRMVSTIEIGKNCEANRWLSSELRRILDNGVLGEVRLVELHEKNLSVHEFMRQNVGTCPKVIISPMSARGTDED